MDQIKVLLLGVDFYKDNQFDYYMEELKNLTFACDFTAVGMITQKLDHVNQKHYVGKGKIEEVIEYIENNEVDLIITNNEIGGMQNKNLEKLLDVKIMDRTQLILKIFSKRAKTKEAQLQVSIAQLKYQKPRMIGSYDNLSKQGGGKVGTVARGSGEKKIETDRRKIDDQISYLEKELEKFKVTREIQRKKRSENSTPIVSLVGYTNAGKSSLMNLFVNDEEKSVFEKDMLFATLDTTVRKIELGKNKSFLLVDTVGFVSNLPHELIKSFRSTLEEILEADLILNIVDISNEENQTHEDVVKKTLKEINANEIEILTIYNKIDLIEKKLETKEENIYISAKEQINIDGLITAINSKLYKDTQEVTLMLKYNEMNVLDKLRQNNEVIDISYLDENVEVKILLNEKLIKQYKKYLKE